MAESSDLGSRCIMRLLKSVLFAAALACGTQAAQATDLTIHLAGTENLTHKTVQYSCDAAGEKIGVPAGSFTVEYINGGGNSLVVVPIAGNSLIFTNVISGSGARYTARDLTWWEGHGEVTLYTDSLSGKSKSTCKVANK
jgi:membrane-bound inhibitor of C-type lysozyme